MIERYCLSGIGLHKVLAAFLGYAQEKPGTQYKRGKKKQQ
jgi:hypothetical protein